MSGSLSERLHDAIVLLPPEKVEADAADMLATYLDHSEAERAANDVIARIVLGGHSIIPTALLREVAAAISQQDTDRARGRG